MSYHLEGNSITRLPLLILQIITTGKLKWAFIIVNRFQFMGGYYGHNGEVIEKFSSERDEHDKNSPSQCQSCGHSLL